MTKDNLQNIQIPSAGQYQKINDRIKKWAGDLQRHTDGQKITWKRCSTSLITREMQIKTARRYHLMLIKMAIINRSTTNKCWRGCGERGTLLHCCWECKLVQPLWETAWRVLRQLNIELPDDPAIPLLGIYLDKTFIQKDTCTPILITGALFTIAKTWKPKCPSTDEWIKKMWYRSAHRGSVV